MKTKRILAGIIVALVLAALVIVALSARNIPQPSLTLSDGSVLTFEGVLYQPTNFIPIGTPLQRMFYRILPAKLKRLSKAAVWTAILTDTNNPGFLIREKNIRPARQTAPFAGIPLPASLPPPVSIPPVTAIPIASPLSANLSGVLGRLGWVSFPTKSPLRILDEYGCTYTSGYSSVMSSATTNGVLRLVNPSPVYPQGRIVGLYLRDGDDKPRREARFMLPGAKMVPLPEMKPPLPGSRQEGDISVELVRVLTGLKSDPKRSTRFPVSLVGTNRLFSQLEFRITKNGLPSEVWTPQLLSIRDRAQKPVFTLPNQIGWRDDNIVLNFGPNLDPAAGPYRFEVYFNRDARLAAEGKSITFKNIPLPAADGSTVINQQGESSAARINLLAAYGEHAINKPVNYLGNWMLEAEVSTPFRNAKLTVIKAVDDQGARVAIFPTQRGKSCYLTIINPRSAKSLDLELGIEVSALGPFSFEATPVVVNAPEASRK